MCGRVISGLYRVAWLWLALVWLAGAAHAAPRVVSLLPALTEAVCMLGACARLVGVDRYSNWPEAVQALPKVGGGLDPDVEAVLALRPDVVLMSASAVRSVPRLRALGLRVVTVDAERYEQVPALLQKVAQTLQLNAQAAPALWRGMQRQIQALAATVPTEARGARVYMEVSGEGYAAGQASFVGEMLAQLGVRSVVPQAMGAFPKIEPEWVLHADPALIVLPQASAQRLTQRPGWRHLAAVQKLRVCGYTPSEGDALVRPGPRMVEGARWMARCLREVWG